MTDQLLTVGNSLHMCTQVASHDGDGDWWHNSRLRAASGGREKELFVGAIGEVAPPEVPRVLSRGLITTFM